MKKEKLPILYYWDKLKSDTLFDCDYEAKESQSLTIDVIIIPSEEAIAALSLLSDGLM